MVTIWTITCDKCKEIIETDHDHREQKEYNSGYDVTAFDLCDKCSRLLNKIIKDLLER